MSHVPPDPPADPPEERLDLDPRQRLLRALRPRGTRGEVLGGLLCAVLGFALVVQVQQTEYADLNSLSEEQLIPLLETMTGRSDRLAVELDELRATRAQLQSSTTAREAARTAAQNQVDTLGILAGTSRASGPGIRLTITDPSDQLPAAVLLDAIQELRDSGAEAIQVGDARVVASTAFTDTSTGAIEVGGVIVESPYVVLAIGDPPTLSKAMDIPGGVIRSVGDQGADADVEELDTVVVTALRTPETPRYARPSQPTTTP